MHHQAGELGGRQARRHQGVIRTRYLDAPVGVNDRTPDHDHGADHHHTTTAPAAPAHITVLSLKAGDKRDPKTGEITDMTAVFTTRTPTIFVTAKLKGLEKGDEITAQLIGVNISGANGAKARNKQLAKTAIESTGNTAIAGYHFTPPKAGWPTGLYQTNILVNGQQVRSLSFTVKRAP